MTIRFSMSVLVLVIVLGCSAFSIAQTAQLSGKVELKKPDGSLTPVAGATIQLYRTDVLVRIPETTTDKNGVFIFVGLPFIGTYTLAVGGPDLKADILSNLKPGKDANVVVVRGDGKIITDQELKAFVEKEKQVREANKRIEITNAKITTSLNEGLAAFKAQNYDLAIEKFDQGIKADPDYPGSATVLNNNKAAALRNRGVDTYNLAVKTPADKDLLRSKSLTDFQNSLAASKRTLDLISKITDPGEATKYNKAKYDALLNSVEIHRLLLATALDTSRPEQAVAALEKYLSVETDVALKIKNQVSVADALRISVNSSAAIPIYRKVISVDKKNLDAIAGLGLSLLEEAEIQGKPELFQESLNLLEQFVSLAPDTHPLKSDVKMAISYLRDKK